MNYTQLIIMEIIWFYYNDHTPRRHQTNLRIHRWKPLCHTHCLPSRQWQRHPLSSKTLRLRHTRQPDGYLGCQQQPHSSHFRHPQPAHHHYQCPGRTNPLHLHQRRSRPTRKRTQQRRCRPNHKSDLQHRRAANRHPKTTRQRHLYPLPKLHLRQRRPTAQHHRRPQPHDPCRLRRTRTNHPNHRPNRPNHPIEL